MSDYPPGEFIDPTESPERTKFREKFLSLFSSGEIDVLVNKQFPAGLGVELDEAVALTRASSMAKESENPQIRSWSTCIANTLWYTYQRILEKMNEQERHPNMLYYRPDNRLEFVPVIKLINKKHIPFKKIKHGLETAEFEIDENNLNLEEVINITSAEQLEELKTILFGHIDPNAQGENRILALIDFQIKQFKDIEKLKKAIEARV